MTSYVMKADDLLKNLNPAQREAVIKTAGPLLIIAGAGSGKTRVLTTRVAYILAGGLAAASNILAVTFTNKAANEMKDRIRLLLGILVPELTVATFHSFCARLLRREAASIGYPTNFTIFDEEDSISLVKACLDELDISRNQFPPASMRRKISAAKNGQVDARSFGEKADGYFETRIAQVYTLYENRLRQFGAMDFDDLIFKTVRLLSDDDNARKRYQQRFKYILVDEYQDTNHSQYQLLKLLTGAHMNICVVGDEDQSIYGWRGADISNILNFENDFPGAGVIKLEQNYRSTQTILDAASSVIANNVFRKGKKLWTTNKGGDLLRLFVTDSTSHEAQYVIDHIKDNLDRHSLKETAILYRTNAQSRPFEEFLRRKNIPYQIIGAISFYQRKEIKDVLAYLKLISNQHDDIAFQRIVNYPRRGIGQTSIDKLKRFAQKTHQTMYEACFRIEDCQELGLRPKKILCGFVELIESYRRKKNELDIDELVESLVDELQLLEYLLAEDPLVGISRAENVEELMAAVGEFAEEYPDSSLENFLAEITLYTDLDEYKEIEDKLTLMTLHSAKGLEFDSVYLVGLEDGLFPLARAIENPKELEEERRLFYVGATRARLNLHLSMARVRERFGQIETIPSRFLKELPPALVEPIDTGDYSVATSSKIYEKRNWKDNKTLDQKGIHYEYEEDEIMRVGRIVKHPTFGRGKITKVEGRGESLRLEVNFTGLGVKKIMAKYARLKIVG